jgi:CRP/FNR family transcriptional regulator, cyclic AMP receptor protein
MAKLDGPDNSVKKQLEKVSRFLLAGVDDALRDHLVQNLNKFIGGAEFSFALDGSEAMFKLSNVPHQIAFFAKDLPKRNGLQLTEWLLEHGKLNDLAVVLLCEVPDADKFVDEVVVGRVQFLADPLNIPKLEQTVSRALNYVSHGDKANFSLKFLATGELLMKEGDKADNVYLVKKGRLRAVHLVNSQEHVLGHVEIGEFVGEMAYINGEPRSADVIAVAPCELIEIPVAHLDHILFQKPAWAKALMKTLSRRLKNANQSPK